MIADADANILTQHPSGEKHSQRRPMKTEQRSHCSQVKRRNHDEEHPVEFIRFALHQLDCFGSVGFLRLGMNVVIEVLPWILSKWLRLRPSTASEIAFQAALFLP